MGAGDSKGESDMRRGTHKKNRVELPEMLWCGGGVGANEGKGGCLCFFAKSANKCAGRKRVSSEGQSLSTHQREDSGHQRKAGIFLQGEAPRQRQGTKT